MHRLFTAIRPPESIRGQLLDLMEGMSDARWQDEDQIHLTLRFIGEVDKHQAHDLAAALHNVRYPPFQLALEGLGTFSRRRQPTILWAGVIPDEPLRALHRKIDQAAQRVGLEPDRRAYSPHITLARLDRSSTTLGEFLRAHGNLASEAFEIKSFGLYESELAPGGAIHTLVETYPLG
jgi:2'-5' RNA ligase